MTMLYRGVVCAFEGYCSVRFWSREVGEILSCGSDFVEVYRGGGLDEGANAGFCRGLNEINAHSNGELELKFFRVKVQCTL